MIFCEQDDESQNCWVFGLFPSAGILENTTFRKLDLFPSSGEGEVKTPTQFVPLERANLNHWTFGLFPSSGILENTTFRKLDLFPSSGEGEVKTPTQLSPLERANHNRWTMNV
jgi:hypothetical protein